MGYKEALEATGVKVKNYTEFGSYQGTWIAELEDGRFVEGAYGSCSGCDAFQAEFNYGDEEIVVQKDGKYYRQNAYYDEECLITEEEANSLNQDYQSKMARFGQTYLNDAESKEEIIARYTHKCEDEYSWEDDKEILEWLKNQ